MAGTPFAATLPIWISHTIPIETRYFAYRTDFTNRMALRTSGDMAFVTYKSGFPDRKTCPASAVPKRATK